MLLVDSKDQLLANLQPLVGIALNIQSQAVNMQLARVACKALQQLEPSQIPADAEPVIHKRLATLIATRTADARAGRYYYSAAEQAINTIFKLHPNPETLLSEVIKLMTSMALEDAEDDRMESLLTCGNVEQLSRLVFVLGHVAVKSLVALEAHEVAIKKLKSKAATAKQERQQQQLVEHHAAMQAEEAKPKKGKKGKAAAGSSTCTCTRQY